MAKKSGKKILGVPKMLFVVILVGVAAGVGYYVYKKKGNREAMRARAFRSAMIARRPV